MRAHEQVPVERLDEDRVRHRPCRVVLVEVQRVEVEPLVFEFGAFGDLPPHPHEDVGDGLVEERERVARTGRPSRRQGRDVHALRLEPRALFGLGQHGFLRRDGLVHPATGLTDELARGGLLLRRDAAHRRVHPGERRLLTGVLGTGLLQLRDGGRGVDGGQGRVHGVGDRRFADLERF